jgi:hypothetical protein
MLLNRGVLHLDAGLSLAAANSLARDAVAIAV